MVSNLIEASRYTLVIAEKPDAARRIAAGLGNSKEMKLNGITIQNVPAAFDGGHYVIASAAGHLYGLADPQKQRRVYPSFDVEWYPLNSIVSSKRFGTRARNFRKSSSFQSNLSRRIQVIEQLAQQSERIVHACDYDIEGETIGYNIIEFAAAKVKSGVPLLRAKFSTLTESEIRSSFSELKKYESQMAKAGRARHVVDFVWGINLSRAITEVQRKASQEYRNLSIGRVQGPTLAFVANREIENRIHVPIPYWSLGAILSKDGIDFQAHLQSGPISTRDDAERAYNKVSQAKIALVLPVEEKIFEERPPFPFNLGDLQREAFRIYHFSPSATLSIAERLYLSALISYPRTTSQKLPPSIGYSSIIGRLIKLGEYSKYSGILSEGNRRKSPVQGFKDDTAHPAIYPTGFKPANSLNESEMKIYDLIVRRFLSCFCQDSLRKSVTVDLDVGDLAFVAGGGATLRGGWREVYSWQDKEDISLPKLSKGDTVEILSIKLESKFSEPPRLYSSASLLARMESENIGTKATRADTISTLLVRGYIVERGRGAFVCSDAGLALIDALNKHCPQISSTQLTRETEELIERIQNDGSGEEELIQRTMKSVLQTLEQIRASEKDIGSALIPIEAKIGSSASHARRTRKRASIENIIIGRCPSCSNGEMKVNRSFKTGKRFLGCTNYSRGCRTSAPLPARGMIGALGRTCYECRWPMLSIRFSGRSSTWVLCPNISCQTKKSEGVTKSGEPIEA